MREIGRGSNGKEGSPGVVTVAAAVAILERQQEEQRRVAPSVVLRHRQHDDLSRSSAAEGSGDSSDTSANSVGETIARLQNRFSAGGGGGGVGSSASPYPVDRKVKADTNASSEEHINNTNDLPSTRKKESENSQVSTNHALKYNGGCFNESRKSPSTKILKNSVVSTLNNVTLSSSDSKKQDVQEKFRGGGASKVDISSRLSPTECLLSDNKIPSVKQQFKCKVANSNYSRGPGELQRSSSAKEALDLHDACDYDDDGLGAASVRNETVHTDGQLQGSVKGSTSDSNIPRRRPRVIHLRNSASKDDGRSKSSPEVASGSAGQQPLLPQIRSAAGSAGSHNSSVRIVLEYPPPPPSPPPEDEDRCFFSLTGGSSPSSTRRILTSTESLAASSEL